MVAGEGAGRANWELQSEPQSFVFALEPTLLTHPAHIHLPAPVYFLETTVASYLLARTILPQAHINLIIKLSYFVFAAADVRYVSILYFLTSARFV